MECDIELFHLSTNIEMQRLFEAINDLIIILHDGN